MTNGGHHLYSVLGCFILFRSLSMSFKVKLIVKKWTLVRIEPESNTGLQRAVLQVFGDLLATKLVKAEGCQSPVVSALLWTMANIVIANSQLSDCHH